MSSERNRGSGVAEREGLRTVRQILQEQEGIHRDEPKQGVRVGGGQNYVVDLMRGIVGSSTDPFIDPGVDFQGFFTPDGGSASILTAADGGTLDVTQNSHGYVVQPTDGGTPDGGSAATGREGRTARQILKQEQNEIHRDQKPIQGAHPGGGQTMVVITGKGDAGSPNNPSIIEPGVTLTMCGPTDKGDACVLTATDGGTLDVTVTARGTTVVAATDGGTAADGGS